MLDIYLCFLGTATVTALDFSAEIISYSVLHADRIKKMWSTTDTGTRCPAEMLPVFFLVLVLVMQRLHLIARMNF